MLIPKQFTTANTLGNPKTEPGISEFAIPEISIKKAMPTNMKMGRLVTMMALNVSIL